MASTGGKTCIYYGSGPIYTSAACPGVSPVPSAGQTIVVDARGKKTTCDFDTSFRTTGITDHDGGVTSYAYDASHNRTCVTGPLGHKTGYTYDAKGNVTGVIDANNTDANCGLTGGGVKWTYAYTSRNDIDLETDPRGNKTDYVYDANGNLIEVQRKDSGDAIKLRSCYTVPTSGQDKGLVTERIESTTLTDCTGNKTKFEYDAYGNVTAVVDPRFSGQGTPPKTAMTYDLGGRRLTVTNELSHTTTFTYDNQNNVLTARDNLNNTTTYTYNAKGNLRTVTDANTKVTTYTYDNADRLVSVLDADGKTTAYGYDANGNRTSVTNANRQVVGAPESGAACGTAGTGNGVDDDGDSKVDDGCPSVVYAYDNVNRLQGQTDALGKTWSYTYDAASRLSTRTNARGQVTTYGYNNRNDLIFIDYPTVYPEDDIDVVFQYDGVRNRTQMVDFTGTTTYAYDAVNRLTSVSFPGPRPVAYTYSNVGNRATMTYPGGVNQVSYGYDAANNLTSVTDWNSNQTQYAYDNAGQLTTATLPSGTGIVGTYTYDAADRLTGISWVKGGSQTLASAAYTLDNVGNRTQRMDQLGTHPYAYDNLYRLASVTYPGPSTDTYTYDAAGNRLTKNATAYTYDAADRMLTAGGVSSNYNSNGDQTIRGNDSFAWDREDRLTSATIRDGTKTATITNTYNGDGLRNSRATGSIGGPVSVFTWDVAAGIPQIVDDGTFKYVYGLGRIAQVGPGAASHYYLADALGSTMALVNGSGAIVNTYEYDVFGAVRASTGSQPNEFKFAGEQVDDFVGLVVERLPLDTVVSSTNLTGATVANLDDAPKEPDGAWATKTTLDDTELRVGFPTPSAPLKPGPGQWFEILLRKDAPGGNDPSYDIELWEADGSAPLAYLATGRVSSDTGELVTAIWDADLLTVPDGSKVEVRIIGHRSSGSPASRRTVEVGAVLWRVAEDAPISTGLMYLRARYYDMGTGRFISRDPLRVSPAFGAHDFSYAANNPILFIDPWGLCKLKLSWENAKACVKDADNALVKAADFVLPEVDFTSAVQLLDVLPVAEACGIGAGLVAGAAGFASTGPVGAAIAGASVGYMAYRACGPLETVIGSAAAVVTATQIARSSCGPTVKTAALGLNARNLEADRGQVPLLSEITEIAAYLASNELLQNCPPYYSEAQRAGSLGQKE